MHSVALRFSYLSMFEMIKYDWATRSLTTRDNPFSTGDYAGLTKKLAQIGRDNGIVCNQSHAPFPSYASGIMDYLKRAIECTAIAGGEICVIHPDNYKGAKENAEFYFELLPFAKEYGVKIATENMFCFDKEKDIALPAACSHHDDFLAHLEAVNDPYLVACLDIGHAAMAGLDTSPEEMIRTLGNSIEALHVHDNDLRHDKHQIPFSMNIDFEKVIAALKKIGYKGYITLEADSFAKAFSADSAEECAASLSCAARRLADMFERA